MRALAPLPAFLLLAASAAACPFGYPGHVHPSAAQAAAAAAPLPAGRCDGGLPAPEEPRGGKPWDLRAHPIPDADLPSWELAGFRVDGARARLLDAKGAPLTEEGMRFLEAPWEASRERVSVEVWNNLMLSGYRLDEATCLLHGPGSEPLSRVAVRYTKGLMLKGLTQISLERLLSEVRALPPGAPIPARVRGMAQQMSSAGAPLPAGIRAVLDRPGATVGALRGPATAEYEGLQRFFDGQLPAATALGLAVPASGGAAKRRAPYRDSAEREFGRALQGAFRAELSRGPVGADLLARFDRNPRQGMPNVLILKLTQRPQDSTQAAIYNPGSDTIVINHWAVAAVVRMRAPPGKRAELEPLLSDPARLMAFVSKDPALMKAVIGEIDVEYFHELLHADQSRRTRIDDEAVRGNTPGANPLDKEREAHREHCRYLFSKASYDPAAVTASRWRNYCAGMLRDPDAFQDEVARNYLSTMSGNATGAEFLRMQEVRKAAAAAPAGSWSDAARRLLRRAGLRHGDEAIADFNRDVRARDAAFNAGIGAFRERAAARMSEASRGQPDLALEYLALDPKWTDAPASEEAVASATRWLAANKSDASKLDARLAVENLLNLWHGKRKTPLPNAVLALVGADYRAAAAEYLKRGAAAKDRAQRQAAFDAALAYASAVNDRALIARIRALRNGT